MSHIFVRFVLLAALGASPAFADSSSPKLAAYYDRHMAIVAGKTYAWESTGSPDELPVRAVQVGVGRDSYYALTNTGSLVRFRDNSGPRTVLMVDVKRFAAGHSGVLAITVDDNLWWVSGQNKRLVVGNVAKAAVGDGANYYITSSGDLFVKGSGHRGQHGDGRLKSTDHFIQTASNAAHITAHTGHAILLTARGDVVGTGGNIYGPVGKHGLGDKAVRWSKIMSGARAIATGSSHSLAIRNDNTLMAWGRGYAPEPRPILTNVEAVAAGSRTTIALKRDGTLWQWTRAQEPEQLELTEK